MKLLFVSPVVQEFDVLQNAVLQDISLKSTYGISINDIPDYTTHIAFMFHKVDIFSFTPISQYPHFEPSPVKDKLDQKR